MNLKLLKDQEFKRSLIQNSKLLFEIFKILAINYFMHAKFEIFFRRDSTKKTTRLQHYANTIAMRFQRDCNTIVMGLQQDCDVMVPTKFRHSHSSKIPAASRRTWGRDHRWGVYICRITERPL